MSPWLLTFIYLIAAYGLSNMVVFGSGPLRVFEWVRYLSNRINEHFGKLFSCMMCFPANLGLFFSIIDWFLIKQAAILPFNILLAGTGLWWLAAILDCCFTSGGVWLIHNVESFFENIAEGNSKPVEIEDDDDEQIDIE